MSKYFNDRLTNQQKLFKISNILTIYLENLETLFIKYIPNDLISANETHCYLQPAYLLFCQTVKVNYI